MISALRRGTAAAAIAVVAGLGLAPAQRAEAATTFAADTMLIDANINLANTASALPNYEIFAGTTGGGPLTQLTNDPTYDSFSPRISPTDDKFVFVRYPVSGTTSGALGPNAGGGTAGGSVWTMNADGTGLLDVIPQPNPRGWGFIWHAEWSADGAQMVLLAGATASSATIVITDSAGSYVRDLLPSTVFFPGNAADPSWSPDGQWIVFVGTEGGSVCPFGVCEQVYKVHPDGTALTQLTTDPYPKADPYMNAQDSVVGFTEIMTTQALSPTDYSTGIVNSDGTGFHYLIDDTAVNGRPQFSADGTTVYFERVPHNDGANFSIWSIPAGTDWTAQDDADEGATGLTEVYAPPTQLCPFFVTCVDGPSEPSQENPAVVPIWPANAAAAPAVVLPEAPVAVTLFVAATAALAVALSVQRRRRAWGTAGCCHA